MTVGIGSPFRRVQLPRVYPVSDSHTPSGSSVVEIYPEVDGEYQLRPLDARGGGVATRLRLYRDVRASRRRVAIIDKPGWEIGLEVAAGWHSAFDQFSSGSPNASRGRRRLRLRGLLRREERARPSRASACARWASGGAASTAPVPPLDLEPRLRISGKFEQRPVQPGAGALVPSGSSGASRARRQVAGDACARDSTSRGTSGPTRRDPGGAFSRRMPMAPSGIPPKSAQGMAPDHQPIAPRRGLVPVAQSRFA